MAGGLFAIFKDYFLHIGTYDPALELWGGENIELSLKLWLCGGGIFIHPCSRVAHIFRDSSPYLKGAQVKLLARNTARVAQVWADDYGKFFFKNEPYNETKYGSVQERTSLRRKLKCRPFGWYLKHVYPELHIEGSGKYWGKIKSATNGCIHRAHTSGKVPLQLIDCTKASRWELSRLNEIRTVGSLCMDRPKETFGLLSQPCDLRLESQVFEYSEEVMVIRHIDTQSCLTASPIHNSITFQPCLGDLTQQWVWPKNLEHIPPLSS